MAGFWMGEETQTRALVLLSFAAHLTLALLAGIRRRKDSGLRRSLVWLAYHVTEIGTPIALGKVFLYPLKVLVAYREQQMFAFWAPFLLLHLGRPDNITSYALENKELSLTHVARLVLEIGGAIYGSYKQEFMRGDGALRAAFFIMLFFGSYKYVERAVALHRASFANIRRSNERKVLKQFSFKDKGRKQGNDDALLDAHGLLRVTMGAFADYQFNRSRFVPCYSGWKDVIKVEMEASLMYDILYTKASVIHTWGGYIIRVLSPAATAMALYLFHSKKGQAMESADRMVTYILLVGTLVLDVIWLLRALGSTWTYVFLAETLCANSPWPGWPKQAGRQAGRQSWYCVRRLLVSLDPSRLSLRSGPSGHRLLSGVGQHNLLHECSTPRGQLEKMISFCAGPGKKKIDVKDELLLVLGADTIAGMRTVEREVLDYFQSNPTHYSFQRNLIALHVATDIFLSCRPTSPGMESEASAKYEKKIRAMSDYMMFLLAERQHMVFKPGEKASHYKKARLDLKEIWREKRTSSSPPTTRETKQLANILLKMNETQGSDRKASPLSDRNKDLSLGADWALELLHEMDPASYGSERHPMSRLEDFFAVFTDEAQTYIKRYRDHGDKSKLLDYMLQLILISWVRLLRFMSDECSRESHAKQLSCGGELLTIVWLMKRHKYVFAKLI